jgi:hypothetical protein
VADPVELIGADAGLDVRPDHLQNVGGESSRNAHFVDFVAGFYRDCHDFPYLPGGAGGALADRIAGNRLSCRINCC